MCCGIKGLYYHRVSIWGLGLKHELPDKNEFDGMVASAEIRYLVFQCPNRHWEIETAVLDQCHKRRNIAEYEGHLEIDSQLLKIW